PPSLLNLASSGQTSCFVALDGIDHAVNVGSILRNCAAFGVTAVLVDDRSASPYSWRSIRTSLGSVFYVPVSSESSLNEQLHVLQEQNIELIAVDPQASRSLSDFDFTKNCCFIFGSEHAGISADILNLATARIRIHHSIKVDSLNVAAASAIILHRSNEARSSLRLQ
ncbi:MAG: TrmH family RNA methyltransferase, partial [Acidobacteriota bacterium]